MNVEKADEVISQLVSAIGVLQQGKGMGIRVLATTSAIEDLRQSNHPEAEAVIANLVPIGVVPESIRQYF